MKQSRILPLISGAVLVCLTGWENPAQALTFTLFNNLASWQTAAGTGTVETFNSTSPQILPNNTATPFTTFNLTPTQGTATTVNITAGGSGANVNGTNFVGWGGSRGTGPNLLFSFAAPQTAFAFDFKNNDPTDNYNVQIAGSNFPNAINFSSAGFFGVVALDGTFTSASILYGASGGFNDFAGVDNVRTSGEAAAVPFEFSPGLGLGALGGLFVVKRLVKKKKTS